MSVCVLTWCREFYLFHSVVTTTTPKNRRRTHLTHTQRTPFSWPHFAHQSKSRSYKFSTTQWKFLMSRTRMEYICWAFGVSIRSARIRSLKMIECEKEKKEINVKWCYQKRLHKCKFHLKFCALFRQKSIWQSEFWDVFPVSHTNSHEWPSVKVHARILGGIICHIIK